MNRRRDDLYAGRRGRHGPPNKNQRRLTIRETWVHPRRKAPAARHDWPEVEVVDDAIRAQPAQDLSLEALYLEPDLEFECRGRRIEAVKMLAKAEDLPAVHANALKDAVREVEASVED